MDNFGSAYAVGGFGQGFAQGFGLMQEQQKINIAKQQEARQQDEYTRTKAQHDIQGAWLYADGQAQQHQAHLKDPNQPDGDVKGALDKVNSVHQQYHLPTISEYQSPDMREHLAQGQQAIQNVQNGMPIHQALSQPGMVKSINNRYDQQLNYDENGKPLNETIPTPMRGENGVIPAGAKAIKREVMDFTPGPNGQVIPDLKVTFRWEDKDGVHFDTMADPLTEGRSVLASDSKIKGIGLDKLMDQHAFDDHMYNAINSPAFKTNMLGAYVSQGGKAEDFEPILKKTQLDHDAEWMVNPDGSVVEPGETPKPGARSYIGTVVRDQVNPSKIISREGVPTEKSAKYLGQFYRGGYAADQRLATEKYKILNKLGLFGGSGGYNKQDQFLTDMYMQQVNPQTGKNFTQGEAMQQAALVRYGKQYMNPAQIQKMAELIVKDARQRGETVDVRSVMGELTNYQQEMASNYISPGQQTPGLGQPQAQPQAQPQTPSQVPSKGKSVVDQKVDPSTGAKLVKYDDGSTEEIPAPVKPGLTPPKPRPVNQTKPTKIPDARSKSFQMKIQLTNQIAYERNRFKTAKTPSEARDASDQIKTIQEQLDKLND